MLHQGNGKILSTKETIVVSQDCPKLLGLPVTCGSQRVNSLTQNTTDIFSKLINYFFPYFISNG